MKRKYYEEEDRELVVDKDPYSEKEVVIKDSIFVKAEHTMTTGHVKRYTRRQTFDLIKMLFEQLGDIKFSWDKGKKNSIAINFDGQKIGALKFMDKKDVVRFALNVAKHNGLTPHEFAKLSNEVMGQEMKDWK